MEKETTIYDLEFHQGLEVTEHCIVTRVAGGWIYEMYSEFHEKLYSTVFVPYSAEFLQN